MTETKNVRKDETEKMKTVKSAVSAVLSETADILR